MSIFFSGNVCVRTCIYVHVYLYYVFANIHESICTHTFYIYVCVCRHCFTFEVVVRQQWQKSYREKEKNKESRVCRVSFPLCNFADETLAVDFALCPGGSDSFVAMAPGGYCIYQWCETSHIWGLFGIASYKNFFILDRWLCCAWAAHSHHWCWRLAWPNWVQRPCFSFGCVCSSLDFLEPTHSCLLLQLEHLVPSTIVWTMG